MLPFRLIRVLSAAAGLSLFAPACESNMPFNPSDGSGGDCDNTPGVACNWANAVGVKHQIRGFGSGTQNVNGDGEPIANSWLYYPADLTFGPDGNAYVVDWNNHRVREVMPNGTFETIMGDGDEGDGPPGNADRLPYGDPAGCPGNTIALNHPTDVKFMPDGSVVVAAWHDNKIRVIDRKVGDAKYGMTTVWAGIDYGFSGDGGPAYASYMNRPKSLAIDPMGRIYLNDQVNLRIRMIDIDAQRTITTIAGNGMPGSIGDNGIYDDPKAAEFDWDHDNNTPDPSGGLVLNGRTLYIADSLNNRIRKLDLDTGRLTCVATAPTSLPVESCPITSALLQYPMDLEFGPDGRLYVADRDGDEIDAIDLAAGTVTPFAGNGQPCAAEDCVEKIDHPTALEVQLNQPYGFTFDSHGTLYIADTLNSRIVRIPQ